MNKCTEKKMSEQQSASGGVPIEDGMSCRRSLIRRCTGTCILVWEIGWRIAVGRWVFSGLLIVYIQLQFIARSSDSAICVNIFDILLVTKRSY